MGRKKVRDMPRRQQQKVMCNIKAQRGNSQKHLKIDKPTRARSHKPRQHKPVMKKGKITPMTERGDLFITNWNNVKIDKIVVEK